MAIEERLEREYEQFLDSLSLHVLRNLAREVGVKKPTAGKKEDLIVRTLDVLTGRVLPVPHSKRGAPLKENAVDPALLRQLEEIGKNYEEEPRNVLKVSDSDQGAHRAPAMDYYQTPVYQGVLEILPNGCGYVRLNNFSPSADDVFVPAINVRSADLRQGDFLVCQANKITGNNAPSFLRALSVNNRTPRTDRPKLGEMRTGYPEKAVSFTSDGEVSGLRALELFVPIGRGQRVLIGAPSGCGATALLYQLAAAVSHRKQENLTSLVLLCEQRPEEREDFLSLERTEVAYTAFNQSPEEGLRTAQLLFDRAQRLAEEGEDVVVFVDSFTRLARLFEDGAANGEVTPKSLAFLKSFFAKAGKFRSGSLTIIAAVRKDEDSPADAYVYGEFKSLCNCTVSLSRALAKKGVYPPLDLFESSTRRAETLLSEQNAKMANLLRANLTPATNEQILRLAGAAKDEQSFLSALTEK